MALVAELTLAPRHLPWHPLDLDARAGIATRLKLSMVRADPERWCTDLLGRSLTFSTRPVAAKTGENGCGWTTAFTIERSTSIELAGQPPWPMRCPLAAAAHIWLSAVDDKARNRLGSAVARIHHAGTYSCRRIYNRAAGRMSEHAWANAWDVTGFELADGRIVSVERHWAGPGPFSRFLHEARNSACTIFDVVLGPDYNAAHHDHFHLDMGGGNRCQ